MEEFQGTAELSALRSCLARKQTCSCTFLAALLTVFYSVDVLQALLHNKPGAEKQRGGLRAPASVVPFKGTVCNCEGTRARIASSARFLSSPLNIC